MDPVRAFRASHGPHDPKGSVKLPTDVLILGNHGLVVGGDDCSAVENLLSDVQKRLTICRRKARPANYAVLTDLADRLSWGLPNDDQVHVLGTDAVSRAVFSGGLLYPCQAIFSNPNAPAIFSAQHDRPLLRASSVPSSSARRSMQMRDQSALGFFDRQIISATLRANSAGAKGFWRYATLGSPSTRLAVSWSA